MYEITKEKHYTALGRANKVDGNAPTAKAVCRTVGGPYGFLYMLGNWYFFFSKEKQTWYASRRSYIDRRLGLISTDNIPKYVRCYDNGGESFDRYTVVFSGNYGKRSYMYIGMSENPTHPKGFGQTGEGKDGPIDKPVYSHLGKKIEFKDLNDECRKTVVNIYTDLWSL